MPKEFDPEKYTKAVQADLDKATARKVKAGEKIPAAEAKVVTAKATRTKAVAAQDAKVEKAEKALAVVKDGVETEAATIERLQRYLDNVAVLNGEPSDAETANPNADIPKSVFSGQPDNEGSNASKRVKVSDSPQA